jgi:hypothetical protein
MSLDLFNNSYIKLGYDIFVQSNVDKLILNKFKFPPYIRRNGEYYSGEFDTSKFKFLVNIIYLKINYGSYSRKSPGVHYTEFIPYKIIANLTGLKTLHITQSNIKTFADIDKIQSLEEIIFADCPHLELNFDCIYNLPHLKKVTFINCPKLADIESKNVELIIVKK